MKIIKIDQNYSKDVSLWVDFPFRLYKDCVQWVPPLKSGAKKLLVRHKHPFYQHSDADFFVVKKGAEVLGRICLFENKHYNEYNQEKAAFFGYFDVVEDLEAARALFNFGDEWARKRDLNVIFGPKGFIGAAAGGFLVEGFEHRPALDIAYNYPYYDEFIKACGFDKFRDNVSGYLSPTGKGDIPERVIQIAERVAERRGYWVKSFKSKGELKAIAPDIGRLHRAAFKNIPGFYPLTDDEVEWMAEELFSVADPNLIKFVMKDDEPIGFFFGYPDISAGLKKANGYLFPLGWLYILAEKSRTEWMNINAGGILPEYQGRGANAVLYLEISKAILATGFKHIDFEQVGEENALSLADNMTFGVEWYKRHRVYKKDLSS